MGDRANVQVIDNDSNVFLYTHWNGTELPEIVKSAMVKGKERWEDGPYLTRVIFQEMIHGDNGITGYGISSVIGDGEDRVIVLSIGKQTAWISGKAYSFDELIKLENPEW